MCFNYIYQITILKVEKLFIPFLVSCVTGGKIVLISKVNFVLLRLKQKKQDMITSVKLMLNKSRILNNGSYPLVFQVIHNRRKKLLYTGYRMKEEVFDESEGKIMNGLGSTFTATEVVKMNRELRKMRNRIDTRIRQLVEVDVVKAIPDAQQRDKVFLANLLLDPLAHGILVNEGIHILEPAVQLEPLGLLAEGFGVFEVERCVSVVCLQEPFFQRFGVVLFLQAGPVGVFLVGDLVIFRVGIQIFGADGRAVVGKVRQRLFRMAGQPGHGAANLVRRRAVDGLQLML